MKVLAIDPSLRSLGWAILTASTTPAIKLKATGLARTRISRAKKKANKTEAWFTRITAQVATVLQIALEYHPPHIVIECPTKQFKTVAKNSNSILKLALLVGRLQGHLEAHPDLVVFVHLVPVYRWKG